MSYFKVPVLLFICAFMASTSMSQKVETHQLKEPAATVGDETIYDQDLTPTVEGQLLSLRNQEYEIKRKGLDSLIEQKLLESAAKKKGLTTDKLLQQEVESKVQEPSDAEIEGFYLAQRDRLNRPLDDALKTQLRASIKQAQTRQLREDYIKQLRSDSKVAVFISPPRVQVASDPKRLRGNPNSPVTIVEFSDYQCPYCHQAESTVQEVLAKYGDKVSLSYRDFPLTAIHSQAMIAAEASHCAEEQGEFWEYHDQLFKATKLEKDDLIAYARNLKLDEKQFESCLTNDKYKNEIEQDLEEGRRAGVTGTPGFFINGIEVSGARPNSEFAKIIDDELARKNQHGSVSISVSRVGR